ncbi:MAG: IclR family transcriptional regulator [Armatimonadia bacterium]
MTIGNNEFDNGGEGVLVQSLLRGLDILRRLGAAEHGLTLRELAEGLGLKQPTVYKLVRTLVAAGFVEKSERPVRYSLGCGAFELADEYWKRKLLRRAGAVVRRLFDGLREYGATVVLTEAPAGEVETVLRMSPERPGILERPRGRVMAPYASACSLTYQAFWTEQERREYQRRHPFWEEGAYLWETPEKLEALLEDIRQKGYGVPIFKTKNVYLVAAPVYGGNQQLVAVLGASMPEQEIAEDVWQEQVRQVVEAAAELSAAE